MVAIVMLTNMRVNFFIVILLLNVTAVAVEPDSAQIAKVRSKHLVYYWVGMPCSSFKNEYAEQFGFKIGCVGCKDKLRYRIHNRRVIRKINRVYGRNWLQSNIRSS